ncbi:hypothetical protein KC460_03350 [Candidatus Dependentiae bacterium]|nr:hypothetical protein [Candidatus Dependentiae bacterium]
MKKILVLLLLVPPFTHSMQIEKKHLSVPGRLGNISVFKTDNGFEVEEANSTRVAVPSYRISKDIRNMKTHQLASFIRNGYIAVNQSTDGEYSLDMRRRLNAGGPILATALYGITKGACYAVGLVAGGAAVAATAGTAIGPVAGGIFAWLGGTSVVTGAVAPGAVVAAGVISGSATATTAATTITAAGGALGFTGVAACIEAAAIAAYTAGMLAPTP